ncbi:MAG TPA: hypothetical protein PKM77_08315, partial [Ottowia sp.]|nr:hypothetical protein [Ottowia sp.]
AGGPKLELLGPGVRRAASDIRLITKQTKLAKDSVNRGECQKHKYLLYRPACRMRGRPMGQMELLFV